MQISDQEIGHDFWMLQNQLHTPGNFIALWSAFPNEVRRCPMIEKVSPVWFKGLESYIANANR